MDSDKPQKPDAKDRLGFQPLAEHLARLIKDQSSKDGLVIGIEGEWGSGKSSLLSFIKGQLKPAKINDAQKTDSRPKAMIVNFAPWLISDRDGLIVDLFDELAQAVEKIEGGSTFPKKEELAGNLKNFGTAISGFRGLAKLAGFAFPAATILEGPLKQLQTILENIDSNFETTPVEQKRELVKALKKLPQPIIVIIDDLDRLEPKEASEVLRLIKAVADFPNIIYVLAYDPEIVGHLLEQGLKVKIGRDYLEKIVQVSFRIPRPEGFYLHNWLKDEVRKLFPDELKEAAPQEAFSLQHEVDAIIDEYGGQYLKTPRHVVRTLNAIELHGLPVKDKIYLPDMIFLQLVRLGNPALYGWIERYVITATTKMYLVSESEQNKFSEELKHILDVGVRDSMIYSLATILPGVSNNISYGMFDEDGEEEFYVLRNLTDDIFEPFILKHRLGSPDHYRYYFALTQPEGTLLEREVEAFINLVQQNSKQAIEQLKEYADKPSQQGKSQAEWLLNRLYMLDMHTSSPILGNRCNLLKVIAENIDELEIQARKNFFDNNLHKQAVLLGERLIGRLPKTEDSDCLIELFEQGKSLGWLTQFFRKEIFSHGLLEDIKEFKGRKRPEDEWLFTKDEFKQIRQIMLQRYKKATLDDLLSVPRPVSLLFGWKQGSDNPNEVSKWVEEQIKTDKELLDFLKYVRSRGISTQNGETSQYYSLKSRDLAHFIDMDKVSQRLEQISKSKNKQQVEQAKELLENLAQGNDRD